MFRLTLILMTCCFSAAAFCEEPTLVSAVVLELTHDPNSAPLESRNVSGKQPPTWNVRLEIREVLRGDPQLKGKTMITATADSLPDGNGRFVTPRLNEGDVGIWAVKHLADGTLSEVYSPFEVGDGVFLPLVKGRHAVYEKILQRLSGATPSPAPQGNGKHAPEPPVQIAVPPPDGTEPSESNNLEAADEAAQPDRGYRLPVPRAIWAVLIIAVAALAWFIAKARK